MHQISMCATVSVCEIPISEGETLRLWSPLLDIKFDGCFGQLEFIFFRKLFRALKSGLLALLHVSLSAQGLPLPLGITTYP